MIEFLLGYVDHLQKGFEEDTDQIHIETGMVNGKYDTLMELKSFIMSDLVPHFIDEDIKSLKQCQKPTGDLVFRTIKRWEEFCDKYPEYLDRQEIKDYMVGQLMQDE